MPSNTPNYNLAIYDNLPAGDQLENFLDYRTAQAGVGATSNMALIDDAMNDNALAITALEAKKNIIAVPAVFDSPNTYLATVSGYTVYGTNDVIDVVLDTDSAGTVTLNINSLGIKSLMKINSSGTPVNLDNTNLLADRHYLFSYDGTRWVWIGATSADQIDIGGTATNLVAIASDGSLEDSTSKAADFVTKALYNANTVLAATADDTPAAVTVAEQTLVGRITGGNIVALTSSQGRTLLNTENTGWTSVSSWTYLSPTTVTVPAGALDIYSIGDKVTFGQISPTKYYYIIGITDTVLTLTGGTDYVVDNSAITSPQYSHQATPWDFPCWFEDDTPVVTGFSVDPTNMINRFQIIGRTCHLVHYEGASGTSNATGFTVALPVTAASQAVQWIGQVFATLDNSSPIDTGYVNIDSGGTVANVYTSSASGSWTNSGTKRARFNISYEI